MYKYLGIYVVIFIASIIFSLVSAVQKREKDKTKSSDNIYIYCLMICGALSGTFIVSLFKAIQGYATNTMRDTFWTMTLYTYVYYGIPLLIMAVLVPIVCKRILGTDMFDFAQTLNSWFCFVILFWLFLSEEKITNGSYSIIYSVCLILTIIECGLHRIRNEYKAIRFSAAKCRMIISVVALFIVTVMLRTPIELYANNISEFAVPFGNYLMALIVGSLIMLIVVLVCTSFVITEKHLSLFTASLMGLTLAGYIQGMFLNGKMEVLDGSGQEWAITSIVINALVWIVLLTITSICFFKGTKIRKILNGICIYLCLVQLVSVLVTCVTVDSGEAANTEALTTHGMLEVSNQKNVFVFVLDRFDTEFFDIILNDEFEFLEPLKDFTYYSNATCQFAHTDMAIPYMLTGTDWVEGMDAETYKDYAFEQSDIFEVIKQEGYELAVYTDSELIGNDEEKLISNYSDEVERKCDIVNTIEFMTQCSKYSMSPIIVKPYYEYYSGDIANIVENTDIWNIGDDLPFYYALVQNGLEIREGNKGIVHFYHMNGAHPPFDTTADLQRVEDFETGGVSQSKGALRIVYEYIEQLKELNKYEESLIIITADHGIQMDNDMIKESGRANRTSIPIVLVKNPNAQGQHISINSAPVSQAELMPTVLAALGIDKSAYGKTFDEIGEDEIRQRSYVDVWNGYINKFTINGNAKLIENWLLDK